VEEGKEVSELAKARKALLAILDSVEDKYKILRMAARMVGVTGMWTRTRDSLPRVLWDAYFDVVTNPELTAPLCL